MEQQAVQTLLPPMLSDMITLLGIVLSVLLLVAVAYLWTTRQQTDSEVKKVREEMKKLSKRITDLDQKVAELKIRKTVSELPPIEPFGKKFGEPEEPVAAPEKPWKKFIEAFNFLAASMQVPGQLKACEKFVGDNSLRMLAHGGMITKFLPAQDVEDSNFWAWKIPETNQYAVVPNPLIPCDNNLYEKSGMKETFALNYEEGTYKKYVVKLPAIFVCGDANSWQIREPGVIDLERE